MPTATKSKNMDTFASGDFPIIRTSWQKAMLWVLGAPALLPIIFMTPSVSTLNGGTVHQSGNDVFGTGGILLLFAMLSITPLRTLTRRQWFVPLRRWYGIVFAFNIFLDAITAANDPAFNGPVIAGRLTGHAFETMGAIMTVILIPLCIQGIWNKWSMKQLGKYWKPFQQYGTYAVWGILGVHLLLLEGFGTEHADGIGPDSPVYRIFHQRFYEWGMCTALMITLRVPPVRRWVRRHDKRTVWLVLSPLVILFVLGYVFMINELMYKGIAAYHLNPIND
jgi:DMSO/TMAO reductase YedYZ heme-binding membrane subunit